MWREPRLLDHGHEVIGANRLSQDFGSTLATVDIAASFPGAGPACLAVRPDGYVGLRADGDHVGALHRYRRLVVSS